MNKQDVTREMLQDMAFRDVFKGADYSTEEIYSSNEWRQLKKSYKKQNPFCELCLKDGVQNKSKEVHHIIPISQGGEPLSVDNIIALCQDCHSGMHGEIGITLDENSVKDWIENGLKQRYRFKLDGVNEKNPDGTDRSTIIQKCKKGELLKLVNLAEDYYDVGVFRESGEQIGVLDHDVAFRVFSDIEDGYEATVKFMGEISVPKGCVYVIEIEVGFLEEMPET
jgi:hypothetical protein